MRGCERGWYFHALAMASGLTKQTEATWRAWGSRTSGKGLGSPGAVAGAERAALASRGGCKRIKSGGGQGQAVSGVIGKARHSSSSSRSHWTPASCQLLRPWAKVERGRRRERKRRRQVCCQTQFNGGSLTSPGASRGWAWLLGQL